MSNNSSRTAVAEMVPWKELQPRAFSLMPLVFNIGAVFGPVLGELPYAFFFFDETTYCPQVVLSPILSE